ncbi:MAG: GtrA family protein [Candidatus Margulisiibacteriota bacterium]
MKYTDQNLKHFIKYAFIGVLNTAVSYLVYSVLLLLEFRYSTALSFSYLIGIIHSYAWNRWWNFRSKSPFGMETARFVSSYIISFLMNLLILRTLIENHSVQPFIAQAIAIIIIAPTTFLLMRYWVFKKIVTKQ